MAINATSNGTTRELIEPGNYVARCYSMIEIGTVTDVIMGKSKTLQKVRIGWELPTELKTFDSDKGEKPLVIDQEYTLSMYDKSNLRKMLESWRGKGFTEKEAECFDITKLIGVPCMLNIIHKPGKSNPGKVYEQIAGVTSVPKSMTVPKQINKTLILSYDKFDEAVFEALPAFIKTKMQSSAEYAAMKNPHSKSIHNADEVTEPFDDLPF